MTTKQSVKLFEAKKVRTVWDDEQEKWYFSVVDVVGVLTDQPDTEHSRNYWKVLKHRLKEEGGELVTNCNQLKHPDAVVDAIHLPRSPLLQALEEAICVADSTILLSCPRIPLF